jgi:hypothetical protein
MNTSRVIVGLVLVAAALAIAIARVRVPGSAPLDHLASAPVPEAHASLPVERQVEEQNVAMADKTVPAFSWHSIESADYREYVRNLRAIGCPEQTLRDIVIAAVTKMFAPREQPLKAMLTNEQSFSSILQVYEQRAKELEVRKQLRAVQLEKNALLQELVGVQLPVDILRAVNSRSYEAFEAAFNALPQGPREVVRAIQEKYWQDSDALSGKYRGTNVNSNWRTPEYLAEYTKLNQQRRAALAQAMTPTQMEDYEMRITDTGIDMRSQFAQMSVSEEEFRKIFRARREAESPYGGGNLTTGGIEYDAAGNPIDGGQQRRAKLQDEIKAALGEERYAQYQKSSDYSYQTLSRLGERYGLAPDAIDEAYALQKQMNAARQTAMVADSAEARSARLRKLGEEFEKKMAQVLGERASKALRRNYGDFGVLR